MLLKVKIWRMLTEGIIPCYFLFSAVDACLKMIGFGKLSKLSDLMMLSTLSVVVFLFVRKLDWFKILFLLFVSVMVYTSLFEEYPRLCFTNALKSQIYVMCFFFIGKECPNICDKVFNKGFLPFIITCVCAIFLYITKPSWYMMMKLNNVNTAWTDGYILEMCRLSGFWPFPYWVSYAAALFFCYLMVRGFIKYSFNKRLVSVLVFLLVIMFLAQQRAPLFFSVGIIGLLALYSLYSRKKRDVKILFYFLLLLISIFIALRFVVQYMDSDMLERMVLKMDKANDVSGFVASRAEIFDFFFSKEISFFGDGLGRYSHVAFSFGLPAITDQQYLKILYESGIWGIMGYGLIIIYSLFNGLKRMRENIFALLVIVMYLMSMFGANCLAVSEEHPAIFWLCCGSIFSTKENSSNRDFLS